MLLSDKIYYGLMAFVLLGMAFCLGGITGEHFERKDWCRLKYEKLALYENCMKEGATSDH